MTNTMLSRAIRSLNSKSDYKVWVYDNEKLISYIAFPNYSRAAEAIQLKGSSVVIGRYIHTGKKYKGRYSFYSEKLN